MRADLPRIQQRAAGACSDIARLNEDIAALMRDVGLAKARLALKDDASAILEDVRDRLPQRAVGSYETLLTRLLRETLPDQAEGSRIKVELATKRGVSSINFLLERPGGECESVFAGNGGALTNIVSAGLRLIALYKARHTLRPFLVLDEPDCWLAPERVSAFYGIIAMAARDLGIQVMVITHHDPAILASLDAAFVRLLPAHQAVAVDSDPVQWQPGQVGIRSLRLLGYRSHADSFIPLSPGVTVLTGQNNLGKSAVIDALRAVAYGEGGDDAIRHGQESCKVEIDAGDKRLIWTRSRKGNPKEMYLAQTLTGERIREEARSRGDVPAWFSDALGLRLLDGIDVQIGHQKKPVFLLDEPAARQAAILSAGKEAAWIDRIFSGYKLMVSEDNATVKRGEERLTALIGRRAVLPGADDLRQRVTALVTLDASIDQHQRAAKDAADLLASLEVSASALSAPLVPAPEATPAPHDTAALSVLIDDLEAVWSVGVALAPVGRLAPLQAPDLAPEQSLADLLRDLARLAPLQEAAQPPEMPMAPALHDVKDGDGLLRDLRRAGAACDLPNVPDVPPAPAVEDLAAMHEALDAVQRAKEDGIRTRNAVESCVQDAALAASEVRAAQDAAGGACPACGHLFGDEHAHP